MEIEVHVIHYLVISTVMLFCGIYGFFTRKNLLALLISAELSGRTFLQPVRHSHSRGGNCGGNSHYHQCLQKYKQDPYR